MKLPALGKPGTIALAVAAAAAVGFAAGYLVARHPDLLRRWMAALAAGGERLTGSAAEAREHLADLWAQAREEAQQAAEDESFAAAHAAAAVSAAARSSSQTEAPAAEGDAGEPRDDEAAPAPRRRTERSTTRR